MYCNLTEQHRVAHGESVSLCATSPLTHSQATAVAADTSMTAVAGCARIKRRQLGSSDGVK